MQSKVNSFTSLWFYYESLSTYLAFTGSLLLWSTLKVLSSLLPQSSNFHHVLSCVLLIAQKEERKNEDKPVESSTASKKIIVSTSSAEKQMSSQMRNLPQKKPSTFMSTSLSKHPIKHSAAGFKGVIPKKSSVSASLPAASTVSKPSPLSYGTSSIPRKTLASSGMGGGSRRPMMSSSPLVTSAAQAKSAAIAGQSQPNSQIRQNIRRSLKEILWKR